MPPMQPRSRSSTAPSIVSARARWLPAVVLATLSVGSGCKRDRPAQAQEATQEPAPQAGPAEPPVEHAEPSVEDDEAPALPVPPAPEWQALADWLPVAPMAGERPPLRWVVPVGCELEYAVQAMVRSEPDGASPGTEGRVGTYVDGRVTARPRPTVPAQWELRAALRTGLIEHGVRLLSEVHPDALAPAWLTTDGRAWTEHEGPTALWSTMGDWPGMTVFFVGLPEDAATGSTTTWRPRIHARGSALATESERGTALVAEGRVLPPPKFTELDVPVQVESWRLVAGQPAAALKAEWAVEESRDPVVAGSNDRVDSKQRFVARYVVLGSGRLLHARVEGREETTLHWGQGRQIHTRSDVDFELRLVKACDGPVIPPPEPDFSPSERALEAFAQLRRAVLARDRDRVRALLSPRVLAAHGPNTPVELLIEHARRYGPSSLGSENLGQSFGGDEQRVTFETYGAFEDERGMNVGVDVEVDVVDDIARIARLRVDPPTTTTALDLSARTASSLAASWTPTPGPPGTILVADESLAVQPETVLLIRQGDQRCALRALDIDLEEVRYEWAAGTTGPDGTTTLADRGTQTISDLDDEPLSCGALRVRWSSPFQVYFDDARTQEFALTEATSLEGVDVDATDLTWLSHRWGQLAYDHEAATAQIRRTRPSGG